jgi:hypothetical protein
MALNSRIMQESAADENSPDACFARQNDRAACRYTLLSE